MSRQRLERLYQLLAIKEKNTQEAANAWALIKDQFAKNKQHHDQLLGYRKDYMQQLQVIGNKGCTIGHLRNRIDFIGQLDKGLAQLNIQLSQLAKLRSQCEKKFLEKRAEQDAVNRLIERVKQQIQHKTARLEQKEIDEYAQKQWYSKKSGINKTEPSD